MRPAFQRGLFWRVYLTLLASLVLAAVLGAMGWHMLGEALMGAGADLRSQAPRSPGVHVLGFLLAIAAIVGFAAYPVMSRLTRRLERLRLSVETWGEGDLSHRAGVDGRDEVAAVAASFNAAADRVETLLAAHKTLLAHASHELRSPLTRLALAAEMFAGGADQDPAPAIRREIAELDALVEEILLASRLDHGAEFGERELVDCLALAAEEGARAGVAVRAVAPDAPAFEAPGSSRLLRRLIRNLIDNAVKHGAAPIEIELTHGSPHGLAGARPVITIAVHDHGRGIPSALRDRVFEPFFRPEGWTEEAGSWGLGLSLVRQIAQRHGGAVACVATEDGVTTFIVELPAGPEGRSA